MTHPNTNPLSVIEQPYQFVCANGCGPCSVKLAAFEYSRTETLAGDLVESKTQPQIVSACCGSAVDVYDTQTDNYTDFQVVAQDSAALTAGRQALEKAQGTCPNGEPCKHGAWCSEVYCQGIPVFRNQYNPQAGEPAPSTAVKP